jgi:Fur family transcriptional regulator, ferric uptake regulator
MYRARVIAELLSSKDLRRTAIREKVLGVLVDRGRPLSHAELVRMIGTGIDRVTLYRTLETLHGAGLLHQVLGEDGVSRYCSHDPDAPSCPGNHAHFLCLGCGEMVCLSDQAMPRVTVPARFTVKSKRLVVSGFCEACQGHHSRICR